MGFMRSVTAGGEEALAFNNWGEGVGLGSYSPSQLMGFMRSVTAGGEEALAFNNWGGGGGARGAIAPPN